MEITVNIPQNDYVQPTEVRQDVVQKICNAFLKGRWYHPYYGGCGRHAHSCIGDTDFSDSREDGERFNGAEMETAFKLLQKAGYHMYKTYVYNGSWLAYCCSIYPQLKDWSKVTAFTEFIDY